MVERTVQVAGFWRRLLAALVDMALVAPVAYLAVRVASALVGLSLPPARQAGLDYWVDLALAGDPTLWSALGLSAAILVLYLLLFQVLAACTPGMRLFGVRVIDVYGDPPRRARLAARVLGYLAAAALGGLGFIWIGFDREKRGLHDWLAGTYVVRSAERRQ